MDKEINIVSTTAKETSKSDNEAINKIKKELIDNYIISESEIKVSDQKLEIFNLLNYSGKYFNNKINTCFIRYFDRTPNYVFVSSEYTLDTNGMEAREVETFLKNILKKLGYKIIKTAK